MDMGCVTGMLFNEEVCLNKRTTDVDEAMKVCGNKKIVEEDDGSVWLSPEYKFRLAAQECREGHADGSGWAGDDSGSMPDDNATDDDVDYSSCLQAAYDNCLESEPMTDRCIEAQETNNQSYWCTFCHDCKNNKSTSTCYTNREIYTQAAQSCFEDDKKAGYLACLDNAREIYDKEVLEREAVCSETFVLDRGSLPCTFGYVNCCCMVKGTLIEHPVDAVHTCQNRADVAQCETWKSHGFCVEGHKYYESMIDNCRSSCELCTADVMNIPGSGVCPPPGGGSSDCDCVEGDVLASFDDYKAMAVGIDEEAKCKSMSGKFKKSKGTCAAAKKAKKVKCMKASNDMGACKALGCDMVWKTNDDGSTGDFECAGKAAFA